MDNYFFVEWEGGSGLGEVIKYCVNNWMQKMGKGVSYACALMYKLTP